jgi:biopolymer transport protein ExbD
MHRPSPASRWLLDVHISPLSLSLVAFGALAAAGCDGGDPPKGKGGGLSAAASALAASSAAPIDEGTPAPPPKPTLMPSLIVDRDGPFLNGTRIKLGEPTGAERLVKVIKDLPINNKPVTLLAEKNAKPSEVAAVVAALGEAGAPKVTIKTDGRNDLPKELSVTPQERISAPRGCAVVTMVLKDLSTAIWSIKGGVGKRQRKGLAGPDLSHTGEQLTKDIAACDATVAFFSGDDAVPWESAFNLAGTLLESDEKKKLDTLVLLREAPVAGRAVAVGKH